MAAPTITNGEEHFFPIIYEGNGASQRVGRFVPFTDNLTVANSCLFNGSVNNYLSRTPGSNGSTTTLTFSAWVKRGRLGSQSSIFFTNDFSQYGEQLEFLSNNTLQYVCTRSSAGVNDWNFKTTRTFEDTSKWYHILISRDTTNSTQADRVKIYVDGERVTVFSTETLAGSSAPGWWNQTTYANILGNTGNASYTRGIGYLAEVNMVDGQALLPADFGTTDTSTGRWVPVAYPTTLTTFTVTVANPGSGNKYYIDGVQQATVTLQEGGVYRFDQSDSSNSGHPLRFSTTSDGSHGGGSEYTTGVTTNGTPGSTGAYTQITVASGAATLYYYCTSHSGMGGTANTPDAFGTNGFKFKFQQSNALGDDTSGKGNDFTSSGLTTNNQTTDSPTQNHCTWDRNDSANLAAFSEGNLKVTGGSASTSGSCRGTLAPKSGKFYFEVKFLGGAFSGHNSLGIRNKNVVINSTTSGTGSTPKSYHWRDDGYVIDGDISTGSMTSGFSTYTTNDYIGVAMDLDNGKLFMSKNGTYEKSGNPVTGANPMFTIPTGQPYAPWWLGYGYTNNNELNCGQRAFNTDPPTGYLALHQGNLPETSKGVTGFTWIKDRDNALNHNSYDSSNGVFNRLVPNATSTILNTQGGVSKFLKGGIVVGDTSNVNNDGGSMVSWNWVANSGTTATNNDGSLTSTVQVNQTAGFSIVQGKYFDGTLGHGLSQTPEWIIYKETSPNTNNWFVWHKDLTSTNYYLYLNSSQAQANYGSTLWAPTSTTFATNLATLSNRDAVAYLWHGVDGFSKFGKYTGNGSADGPFVYTGFKPAWIMVKRINTTGSWAITDIARDPFNPTDKGLVPDSSGAEGTGYTLDHLSNGFKLRLSGTAYNASGSTYIYMAFAEHPFVGDGTNPVTAR